MALDGVPLAFRGGDRTAAIGKLVAAGFGLVEAVRPCS